MSARVNTMNSLAAFCADTPIVIHFSFADAKLVITKVLADGQRPLSLTREMVDQCIALIEETYK